MKALARDAVPLLLDDTMTDPVPTEAAPVVTITCSVVCDTIVAAAPATMTDVISFAPRSVPETVTRVLPAVVPELGVTAAIDPAVTM